MKKQIISVLVLAGCIGMLTSCAFRPCTTMTLNLGPVHSRISGDSESWTGAFGVQGGASFLVPVNFNSPFSLWGELNLSMEGARWEEDYGTGSTLSGITRLWLLNLPLTGKYRFANGFYAEAGIQPGYVVSAKDNYEGGSYDFKDYVKRVQVGVPLGLGKEFDNNFGLSFRFIPGLTNINAGEYADYKDHTMVFVLRGTYTFPKKD
jgi:hypothetical protein